VALVQFNGDLESHRIVSLNLQGDMLEKIRRFMWVCCNARQSAAQLG